MAEDDDDETFGDFTFASFPSSPFTISTAAAAATNSSAGDDDDWVAFVKSPNQLKTSEPVHSSAANQSADRKNSSSESACRTQWVKPSGQLPLSLFGEDDVEEVDNNDKSDGNKSNGETFNSNIVKGSHIEVKVGSYNNGAQQINSRKGFDSNPNTGVNPLVNGLFSSSKSIEKKVDDLWNGDFYGPNSDFATNGTMSTSDQNKEVENENSDLGFMLNGLDRKQSAPSSDLFSWWTIESNGSGSNTKPSSSNVDAASLDVNDRKDELDDGNGDGEVDDADDDEGWDFQDASSEFKHEDLSNQADSKWHEVSERSAWVGSGSNLPISLFGKSTGSVDLFSTLTGPVNLFPSSNGGFRSFQQVDLFGIQPSSADPNGLMSDPVPTIEQTDVKGELNLKSGSDVQSSELDEGFGEFIAAFAETETKQEEASRPNGFSHAEDIVSTNKNQTEEKETKLINHKSALPLSIFGEAEPEADNSLDLQDSFMHLSTPYKKSGHVPNKIFSVSDLISNLYSEAEQNSSTDTGPEPMNIKLSPSDEVSSLNQVPDGDDWDDNLWEFKDAYALGETMRQTTEIKLEPSGRVSDFSQVHFGDDADDRLWEFKHASSSIGTVPPTEIKLNPSDAVSSSDKDLFGDDFDDNSGEFRERRANKEPSLWDSEDSNLSSSSKLKQDSYVDFYSAMKDELCHITKHHLETLKKDRSTAALFGKDAEVRVLDNQLQEIENELDQMNVTITEIDLPECPSRQSRLNEFLEVLKEAKFQVLETEYHLSETLLLAEKDLRSAIQLIRHATTMLKILTLGTSEDQSGYVSMWSKMISVCAQELKHGAAIWKQAFEKNVRSELLSESQGRKFLLALGEIYRVIVVLGASAKLFKPWILSCSPDSSDIYMLLEEYHTLWSDSGLEEALASISQPTSPDVGSLTESIKYICGLDALALQDVVFTKQQSLCRLSILTAEVAPGLKMIEWNEGQYFVTLANLWANLISCNPPELPCLHIG